MGDLMSSLPRVVAGLGTSSWCKVTKDWVASKHVGIYTFSPVHSENLLYFFIVQLSFTVSQNSGWQWFYTYASTECVILVGFNFNPTSAETWAFCN